MTSTTGTAIENYLGWVRDELEKKDYGEVSITFVVTRGQVTLVKKGSFDTESRPLLPIKLERNEYGNPPDMGEGKPRPFLEGLKAK